MNKKYVIIYFRLLHYLGGIGMSYSYNGLWHLLVDKGLKKTDLKEIAGLTPATLARMSKNEAVSLKVLGRICKELDCGVADVIEFVKE